MKRILTFLLTLCLLASVATCFAFSANAEETDIKVTVGQSFAWNEQTTKATGDTKASANWSKSGGVSPDGLWNYKFYSLNKKIYRPLVYNGGNFAWSSKAGTDDGGVGMARVRNYGANFHPGYAADVVKEFTCPSGGTIQISSTVARKTDLASGTEATGTSFAIYVEDRLVYPEEGKGEYLTLVSTQTQTINITVEVAKNERVRIHIGAIGEQTNDDVDMSNTITYKSINDNVAEGLTEDTLVHSVITRTDDGFAGPDDDDNKDNNVGEDPRLPTRKEGLSTGAIIGIVAGAVAVVGIAVVVVIVLKKKQQE